MSLHDQTDTLIKDLNNALKALTIALYLVDKIVNDIRERQIQIDRKLMRIVE